MDGAVRQLGLDLGGTKIKLAVLEDGRCVSRDETETRSEDGREAVLERLVELGRSAGEVDSVGVAVPGLVDGDGNALLFPNLHGAWAGRQVLAPLEAGLGQPVRLVNDGHAFALAEAALGAGMGGSTVMCIVCGTGIGGGLALDGVLHLGPDARAGEFGHHTVAEDGPLCACGNRGCLELYAGARAIAEAAGAASFDEALERARAGDERAVEALRRAGWETVDVDPPLLEEAAVLWRRLSCTDMLISLDPAALGQPLGRSATAFLRDSTAAARPYETAREYAVAWARRAVIAAEWRRLQTEVPLILGPVSTTRMREPDYDLGGTSAADEAWRALRLTVAANFLGLPALALPTGLGGDGMPTGVQLIGPPFGEAIVLAAGRAVETGVSALRAVSAASVAPPD